MKRHLYLGLLLLVVSTPLAVAQQPSGPYVPVAPADLLSKLPPEEPGWKMTRSDARSVFSQWLMDVATREYVAPPAAAVPGSPTGATRVPRTRITLIDTGAFPGFNGQFLGTNGEPANLPLIKGFPSVKDASSATGAESVQIWIARRFILKIETENQDPAILAKWIEKVKTVELEKLAMIGARKLSNPLMMYRADELNPHNDRSYAMSWASEESLQKANER